MSNVNDSVTTFEVTLANTVETVVADSFDYKVVGPDRLGQSYAWEAYAFYRSGEVVACFTAPNVVSIIKNFAD